MKTPQSVSTVARSLKHDSVCLDILDVIGAGATAKASLDWHEQWLQSEECSKARQEIADLHAHNANKAIDPAQEAEAKRL